MSTVQEEGVLDSIWSGVLNLAGTYTQYDLEKAKVEATAVKPAVQTEPEQLPAAYTADGGNAALAETVTSQIKEQIKAYGGYFLIGLIVLVLLIIVFKVFF